MSVKIHGNTFYTASEVSAMTPSGTMDSQWETYTLPIPSGTIAGWNGNRFFVNKVTGLVTGWLTIQQMNALTSTTIGTNSNLAIHPDMPVKYSGYYEYGTTQGTATAAQMLAYKELNGIWNTSGTLTLEGTPSSPLTGLSTFIEHYAHIGSKYGIITSTDIEKPVYLKEGAFYNANTAALICGKAWLRIPVTLPSGYTSSSYLTLFKNLWTGEVIMQYSLYPTTNSTFPAITLPTRCKVVDGRNFYTDIRYMSGTFTVQQRSNAWMRIANNVVSFSAPGTITWATGSYFYPSNPETGREQIASYETTNGLWVDESPAQIPSAQSNKWPTTTTDTVGGKYDQTGGVGNWFNTTYFKGRTGIDNWVWRSKRDGMVFFSWDMTTVGTSIGTPVTTSNWGVDWIPSYRYNTTSGTAQRIYCSGAGYIGTVTSNTPASGSYTCNLAIDSGKTLGAAPGISSDTDLKWIWGTSSNYSPIANNLSCYTGFYLGNSAGNIVR